MIIQRRSFIAGLASLIVAPAIVRAQNIMPVKLIFDSGSASFRYVVLYSRIDGSKLAQYDYGHDVVFRAGDTFTLQLENEPPLTWIDRTAEIKKGDMSWVLR